MAIGYKSAGAGVSTETSGAALSPQCPATVDAGDVLIAHVFWEGTTTAPSTPDGWEPLHGPEVIQSTIARHWIFGRIADGTEDGAAVAFGAPAVTTQRAARIYSFSGRVSGTILELCTGFAHLSHATDPQMPTVTTTKVGALAVAFMAQNDNNTSGNATGESGGDWTEAVAEYVAALTPGCQLQLQTCIPTANPGTVSGGSVATTNDPCGVIGFQIKPSEDSMAGTMDSTLADATQSADGGSFVDATGTIDQTLADATQDATGVELLSGTAASTLDAATSAGAAAEAPQDFTMDFDPNDAGNTVVSGRYSVLKDLSANSYDLEQATVADQPEVVDVGGENAAGFTFDPGVDEFMAQEAGADWLDVVSSTAFTLAARVRMTFNPTLDDTNPPSGIHGILATSFGIFVLGTRLSGGSPEFAAGMYNNGYSPFSIGSGAKSLNVWYDVVARFSGTELSITVNGTKTPTTVSGTLPYFAWEAAPVNMGRNPSGGAYFEGDVRFARIYDYALSDQQVADLTSEWDGGGGAGTTGEVAMVGTSTPTLADATQDASGTVLNPVTGTADNTLDDVAHDASGTVIVDVDGTSAQTLDDVAQTAAGEQANVGSASSTFDDATQSGSGGSFVDASGTIAQALDDAIQAGSGEQANVGSSAQTLGDATQSASGEQANVGSASSALAEAAQSASGEQTNTGASAASLDSATQAATGEEEIEGSAASTLDEATHSATGAFGDEPTGTIAATLGDATQDASGTVHALDAEGTAASTLAPAEQSASGEQANVGEGASELAGAEQTASGTAVLDVAGTMAHDLEDVAAVGDGEVASAVEGTQAVSLSSVVQTVSGIVAPPEGNPPAVTASAIAARLPADRAMLAVSSSQAVVAATAKSQTHIAAIFSGRE
jgi:hypothetical protein